jgi:hypothetical protein
MDEHEFHALLDPFRILVVNRRGILRNVACPFRVYCRVTTGGLQANRFYYVGMVSEEDNKLCYHIHDRPFPHTNFRLFIS